MAWGMKFFLGIVVLLGFGYLWNVHLGEKRAAMREEAGQMWDTLTAFSPSPVMSDNYVTTLWKLATQNNGFRSIFVSQLERQAFSKKTAFGLRPQPVIRAVGLRWPDQERKVVLMALLGGADGSSDSRAWAALACTVEALGKGIDPKTKQQVIDKIDEYVSKLEAVLPPSQLFFFTGICLCP